jgi:hypothetical protein
LFIFFACPKKTNQKKGHQSFAPLSAEFPVLLEPAGSLKTRFAQTVQTPFSAVSAVLGCMTMEKAAKLMLCSNRENLVLRARSVTIGSAEIVLKWNGLSVNNLEP